MPFLTIIMFLAVAALFVVYLAVYVASAAMTYLFETGLAFLVAGLIILKLCGAL